MFSFTSNFKVKIFVFCTWMHSKSNQLIKTCFFYLMQMTGRGKLTSTTKPTRTTSSLSSPAIRWSLQVFLVLILNQIHQNFGSPVFTYNPSITQCKYVSSSHVRWNYVKKTKITVNPNNNEMMKNKKKNKKKRRRRKKNTLTTTKDINVLSKFKVWSKRKKRTERAGEITYICFFRVIWKKNGSLHFY